MRKQPILVMVFLFLTAQIPTACIAQQVVTGHYSPGFGGALLGGQLPQHPGFYYRNGTFDYQANTVRDGAGEKIPEVDEFNILANVSVFVLAPKFKLLGAKYAAILAIPVSNLAPNTVVLLGTPIKTGAGVGDIYVQPASLQWALGQHVNLLTAYGFYATTGRFKLGASNNVGKGFWSHLAILGSTWRGAGEEPFNATVTTRYEFHSKQKGQDLTPGQTLSIDAGIGKFLTPNFNFGATFFFWKQTTNARGKMAADVVKYRLFGVGPALQWRIPQCKMALRLRGYKEFAARNSTQGYAVFFDLVKKLF
jgi:hypothetical protein